MKRIALMVLTLTAVFCCACTEKDNPSPTPAPSDKSLWCMQNDPVEKVDVYCGDRLVETYSFLYNDTYDMVTSIIRTDKTTGADVFKAEFTYAGRYGVSLKVRTSGVTGNVKASFNEDRDCLEYGPDDVAAFSYRTVLDSYSALPITDGMAYTFTGSLYSSAVNQKKIFTEEDSDITSIEWNTSIHTGTSPCVSVADAKSNVKYTYTYSDDEDQQNFAAFLMPCDFPLWFASELPGCRHLITGMKAECGNVTLPESFTVSYTFNDGGSIKTALRTDYSRGRKILERTYKYTYL